MELPKYMRTRPTYGGFVVPYFVAWFIGQEQTDERTPEAKPDFRVTDMRRANICRQRNMCWICGKQLGTFKWFVFGPASALGRVSTEPPSHRDCAHYAVQTCPYLLHAGRSLAPLTNVPPDTHVFDIEPEHPGVSVLWAAKGYDLEPVDPSRGIFYFTPHEPDVVEFWYEGRRATREEITSAIDKAVGNNNLSRDDRDIAWRIEHLMRYAPSGEEAA